MSIPGIDYTEHFVPEPATLFATLNASIEWDTRMAARKTASFGVAYNYSHISYPFAPMPADIAALASAVGASVGFEPNNCLINLYPDGSSRMGFHSDQTDILHPGTGVAIVSLGAARTLRFRNIENEELRHDYLLENGSLVYMTQEVQHAWKHAVPKAPGAGARMSLTFRKMLE